MCYSDDSVFEYSVYCTGSVLIIDDDSYKRTYLCAAVSYDIHARYSHRAWVSMHTANALPGRTHCQGDQSDRQAHKLEETLQYLSTQHETGWKKLLYLVETTHT